MVAVLMAGVGAVVGAVAVGRPPAPQTAAAAVPSARLVDDLHLATLERMAELGAARASRNAPTTTLPAPPPRPTRVRPAAGALTGFYGEHRGSHIHPGIDLDGETGDPVWAAADGTVVEAGPAATGWSGYGTIVVIDHGAGVQTLYAHLSAVGVTLGQVVRAGDRVGAIGVSGNVTGSHLHFEVRSEGRSGDPLAWLGDALPPTPTPTPSPQPRSALRPSGWVPALGR